ncbi:hypothetical protein TNCV_4493401 [Trichonephila clavipes]|uniref:Uncharacterized protein n=1 Tax=Trichonephila clavipes TaxID=2585209 RepID=A0A8X6STN7_TRICX|nr:hypothetical protein TNCV_4493401 [Trichonephila clavipes]
MGDAQGLDDGSMTSLSFMSLMSFWISSYLANGSLRGGCLIGGCSPVSIRCCVNLVLPKSSDALENRLWKSLIGSPAANLCFSFKCMFCSKSLTRSEERSRQLLFRSTQVTRAQADITSPSLIVLVLSLMLATLIGMTDFERSTTEEAISTPALELTVWVRIIY